MPNPQKSLTLLILFSFLLLPLQPTRAVEALNDHLSSAHLITDTSGAVIQKLDYLPFGQERLNEKSANFATRFTFTDQERDDESGLLYYGARYYDPVIGRFTQADPVVVENVGRKEFAMALQNPQMLNGYSYVGNNPMKYEDEEGEFAGLVVAVGIAVLGGVFLQNILPAQAPATPAIQSPAPKTFSELAVPQFDALPGYQKEAIRWAPLLLGGLKSVGKEGLEVGIEKFSQKGITSNDATKLLGTRRDNLLHGVENEKLKNVIENFYRELKFGTKIIGDGGAIDAFRQTAKTGELVRGTDHSIKIQEGLNRLNNLLKNNLSNGDRQKAEWLVNNIKDALKGGGGIK